jgi:hypothetical protein
MEPGVEPIRIAQSGQVPPGTDHSLLDRVARELRVPDDQSGRRVQPRETDIEKLGEGVMIATPRKLDECSLVHGRLECDTTWAVVLDRVWRRISPNRSLVRDRACLARPVGRSGKGRAARQPRRATIASWPAARASSSADAPSSFRGAGSAPAASSRSTDASDPVLAAPRSGVQP